MKPVLIMLLIAAFAFIVGSASADPSTNYPPSSDAVEQALGAHWLVASAPSTRVAHRRPSLPPGDDFDIRLADATRALHQRDGGIVVDVATRGSVHLTGSTIDCDRVVIAAQQFAAIRGVNVLVIDTACRPRD